MSNHYSAGQFSEPFRAKRLRNWQYGINHPGRYAKTRCGTTCFIADERGHLLCDTPRNSSTSPWGDYRQCIWEETPPCTCTDRIRRSADYDRPPCAILVARERPRPRIEAHTTAATMAKHLLQPRPPPEVTSKILHPRDGATQDISPCPDPAQCSGQGDAKPDDKKMGQQGVRLDVNVDSFPKGANIDIDACKAKPGIALAVDTSKCLSNGAMLDVNTEKMGLSGINVDMNLKEDKKGCFKQDEFPQLPYNGQ